MGTKMRKCCGGAFVSSLFTLLILRYGLMKNPIGESYQMNLFLNVTNPLNTVNDTLLEAVTIPDNSSQVISVDAFVSSLFSQRNVSAEEQTSLQTWRLLKHLVNNTHMLSTGLEAMKEAANAWNSLMASVEEERKGYTDKSPRKEKQCPHFLNKMNTTGLENSGYSLRFPCGLTQGSAITVIGIPNGILGNFQFDLKGESDPGNPVPPIIYHFNVRLHGDKITEDPVIVQNTWTIAHDWGQEERCPSPAPEKIKKVDELDQCNRMIGRNETQAASMHSDSRSSAVVSERSTMRSYFPFKQGYPFVATIRLGSEGIQMTVDGKHITSFAYRETLEPWLVNEIRISGDLQIISVLASGLPTTEDSEHAIDLKSLVSPPLSSAKQTNLLIGVFSTANNFQRRMVIRRTWMQYAAVRAGTVSVRFFVGLHKSQIANMELWEEAQTYGDIQLMPFVDYYNLITWKTLAICIFATEVASAKYIMKTDDDAFVRVDEVLTSLKRIAVDHGFLYGLINSDSRPHRSTDSKWYISPEEWPEDTYPPWAHGPGYVVPRDIAKRVYRRYKENRLKMFKLEDVAMGIWIADMENEGLKIKYMKESRIYIDGCKDGYIVAHYQGPREMLCLWQKLQEGTPSCCGD